MQFCTGTLLPRMEERITRLNITIAATRKGLKNRLSRLWKGAAADGATPQVRVCFLGGGGNLHRGCACCQARGV